FFQAEDGIRDLTVTGVQTCALPICAIGWPGPFPSRLMLSDSLGDLHGQRVVGEGTEIKRDALGDEFEAGSRTMPGDAGMNIAGQIGRASCRERMEIVGVDVAGKKKR